MDDASTRRGFGGRSLVVALGSESQTFRGERPWLSEAGGPPLNQVLARALDDSFPNLMHLDEYGNTVFNRLQMEIVIADVRRLAAHAETSEERSAVDAIVEMASRVLEDDHLYLVFIGD